MLIARITPKGGGFQLCGDYLDLHALYESLHEICPTESGGERYPENLVYQLAYDVRKARDGARETVKAATFVGDASAANYRAVTLSLPRAMIQYAFAARLLGRSKKPALAQQAGISAFGAAVISALEQMEIKSPARLLDNVAARVSAWRGWPDSYLVEIIDRTYLYDRKDKRARASELKLLPKFLEQCGPFANAVLEIRNEFAAKNGVHPDLVEPRMPDHEPEL